RDGSGTDVEKLRTGFGECEAAQLTTSTYHVAAGLGDRHAIDRHCAVGLQRIAFRVADEHRTCGNALVALQVQRDMDPLDWCAATRHCAYDDRANRLPAMHHALRALDELEAAARPRNHRCEAAEIQRGASDDGSAHVGEHREQACGQNSACDGGEASGE